MNSSTHQPLMNRQMNFNVGPCTQSLTYKDKAVSTGILQKMILASVVAGCVVLSCCKFYYHKVIIFARAL